MAGLAWSPDGSEVWFTGDESGGGDRALYALSMSGKRRRLASVPGAMTIFDVTKDGRNALVSTGAGQWGFQVSGPAGQRGIDLFGRAFLFGLTTVRSFSLTSIVRPRRAHIFVRQMAPAS